MKSICPKIASAVALALVLTIFSSSKPLSVFASDDFVSDTLHITFDRIASPIDIVKTPYITLSGTVTDDSRSDLPEVEVFAKRDESAGVATDEDAWVSAGKATVDANAHTWSLRSVVGKSGVLRAVASNKAGDKASMSQRVETFLANEHETILREEVKVVGNGLDSRILGVQNSGTLELLGEEVPQVGGKTLGVGDKIVLQHSDKLPQGMMRKVVSIERTDGKTKLKTEEITVDSLFLQADIDFTTAEVKRPGSQFVPEASPTVEAAARQGGINEAFANVAASVDQVKPYGELGGGACIAPLCLRIDRDFALADQLQLKTSKNTEVGLQAKGQLKVKAEAGIKLEFKLKIGFGWVWGFIPAPKLQNLVVAATFGYSVDINAATEGKLKGKLNLFELSEEAKRPILIMAGPVPLEVFPKTALGIDVEVYAKGTLNWQLQINNVRRVGKEYRNNGWHTIDERQSEYKKDAGLQSTLGVGVSVIPYVSESFMVYDIAGPYVKLRLKGDVLIQNIGADKPLNVDITLKPQVRCGVKLEILKIITLDTHFDITLVTLNILHLGNITAGKGIAQFWDDSMDCTLDGLEAWRKKYNGTLDGSVDIPECQYEAVAHLPEPEFNAFAASHTSADHKEFKPLWGFRLLAKWMLAHGGAAPKEVFQLLANADSPEQLISVVKVWGKLPDTALSRAQAQVCNVLQVLTKDAKTDCGPYQLRTIIPEGELTPEQTETVQSTKVNLLAYSMIILNNLNVAVADKFADQIAELRPEDAEHLLERYQTIPETVDDEIRPGLSPKLASDFALKYLLSRINVNESDHAAKLLEQFAKLTPFLQPTALNQVLTDSNGFYSILEGKTNPKLPFSSPQLKQLFANYLRFQVHFDGDALGYLLVAGDEVQAKIMDASPQNAPLYDLLFRFKRETHEAALKVTDPFSAFTFLRDHPYIEFDDIHFALSSWVNSPLNSNPDTQELLRLTFRTNADSSFARFKELVGILENSGQTAEITNSFWRCFLMNYLGKKLNLPQTLSHGIELFYLDELALENWCDENLKELADQSEAAEIKERMVGLRFVSTVSPVVV